MHTRLTIITGLLSAGLIMAPAHAADEGEDQTRQGRRGPPQASIDACVSKVPGDACTFVARNDKEMNGTCFTPRDDVLACKPQDHDMRRQMRMHLYRFHRDDLRELDDSGDTDQNEAAQ